MATSTSPMPRMKYAPALARDGAGITPDGDVISGDGDGDAVNHGPYADYTN